MHWLDNLSLRWKLMGGFGAVLLVIAGQGLITLRSTNASRHTQQQSADSYEAIVLSEQIFGAVLAMQSAERGFLLQGKDSYLEPYTAGWAEYQQRWRPRRRWARRTPPRRGGTRKSTPG